MDPTEEAGTALIRELREAAQLQHASIVKLWQQEKGPHPAAAMLLSELARHRRPAPAPEEGERALVR